MNHSRRLIAATALIGVLAGGGAAFAGMELLSSHSASEPPASVHVGVNGYGLGGRLGGRGFGGGLGAGSGLARGQSRRDSSFGLMPAEAVSALTTYLGMSTSTLKASLEAGKTLAQITAAQGKSPAGLAAVMLAVRTKELDRAVTAGRLTATEEKAILARESQRVRAFVAGARMHGFWHEGDSGPVTT
ncbi:MAG TPA: hypothetical protein VG265_15985 [Gaiellaceae bacterium]|nr:hypothetical protein [Gaiellaceae bacterium]